MLQRGVNNTHFQIAVFTKAEAFEYGDEEELFAWLDVAMNANEKT